MPSTPRISESLLRQGARSSARGRSLACLAVGLLLFETGCPQLLDDNFGRHAQVLSQPDASAGGACGGAICSSGGNGGSSGFDRGGAAGAGGTSSGAGGSQQSGGSSGAGGSAGATIAELRNCPFGEPEALVGLDFASGSEWGASLTSDGLTLYFAHQDASGDADLYRATRPDRGVTFSAPVALTNLNTNDDEGTPFISADGLRLYYFSTRAGGPGARDLYVTSRLDIGVEFPSGQLLTNVNSDAQDHLPRLAPDELTLWFTSTRAGGAGGADLWTATRANINASFGTPTSFDAINGSSGDESGGVTQDGLMLFFDSTRDGVGNSEIFTATRASAGAAFASPTLLSVVNSEMNEYNVFLAADERELFFSSNRVAGATHHLFRSLRSCN